MHVEKKLKNYLKCRLLKFSYFYVNSFNFFKPSLERFINKHWPSN